MNGYNFTERVREVLAQARNEAARLHHEYVGTEHILLGLLREGDGVGASALRLLGVDLDGLIVFIDRKLLDGDARAGGSVDLPYTSRAKKVLELSMSEARDHDHSYVGTEHLLLGLLLEENGFAAQSLVAHGVDLSSARRTVLSILGHTPARFPLSEHEPTPHTRRPIASYEIRVHFADGTVNEVRFTDKAQAIVYVARQ